MKLNYGALLGLVIAIIGLLTSADYVTLLPESVGPVLSLIGSVLAAVRGALFSKTDAP